jgi:flagellar hook-basal body complex protein FliE
VIAAIPAISAALSPAEASSATSAAGQLAGGAASGAAGTSDSFTSLLGNAIDQANGVQQNAATLALEGATGQASVADVTVASTEAELSMQLITAVRDKAVDAVNSIMSMST